MTTINTSLLVLLDPNDEYKQFDTIYDAQCLSRFTDKNRCVAHVLSRRAIARLLHFFMPNAESSLIGTTVTLCDNTVFYIYCIDEVTVKLMESLYNHPMFVKIFHVQWLSTYLKQAALAYLINRAERRRHEPDEYDTTLQAASEYASALAQELNEYMIVKTGRQPDDHA
jgi:hypothetical protein